MQLITQNHQIAKIWVEDLAEIDPLTLDQIKKMLQLPHLFSHIAIMPDAHAGRGAVVGAVVATKEIVVPNIVGVDIGCGVSALATNIHFDKQKMTEEFWYDFKTRASRTIPTGFSSFRKKQDLEKLHTALKAKGLQSLLEEKATYQVGTLGGGNHFLEAQIDETGLIWLMVHSGSRHTGLQIADFYNRLAKELNQKQGIKTPPELYFLDLNKDGRDYLHDMNWAIEFALENRWRMLENLAQAFMESYKKFYLLNLDLPDVRGGGINIHHNFANIETHFGQQVVIHRKGATQAFVDQVGIIPGSMGAPTFIVKGLGNPESFMSCAHGAGRKMSRTQAKKDINQESFVASMKDTFTKPSSRVLDEAPGAYKNISKVMANQKDLVEVIHQLKPIITFKGEGD